MHPTRRIDTYGGQGITEDQDEGQGRGGASARNLWQEQNPNPPSREKWVLSTPIMYQRGHRGLGLAVNLEVTEMKMWPLEIRVCTSKPLWGRHVTFSHYSSGRKAWEGTARLASGVD